VREGGEITGREEEELHEDMKEGNKETIQEGGKEGKEETKSTGRKEN
jgi:hypothetical protein